MVMCDHNASVVINLSHTCSNFLTPLQLQQTHECRTRRSSLRFSNQVTAWRMCTFTPVVPSSIRPAFTASCAPPAVTALAEVSAALPTATALTSWEWSPRVFCWQGFALHHRHLSSARSSTSLTELYVVLLLWVNQHASVSFLPWILAWDQ